MNTILYFGDVRNGFDAIRMDLEFTSKGLDATGMDFELTGKGLGVTSYDLGVLSWE